MSRIRCPLNETAWINQKDPACLDRNRVVFYPQLDAAANQIAIQFEKRGLAKGCVVAVQEEPQWRWISLWFACLRYGAVLAPLPPGLPGAIRDQVLAVLQPGLTIREQGDVRLDELCAIGGDVSLEKDVSYPMEQTATILQTSGSTGDPTFWAHSVEAHYYAALGANRHIPLKSKHRWLLSLPLHHAGGLTILSRCLLAGAAIAIPNPDEDLGEEVQLYRATHLSLVPTQLRRLLKHPDAEAIAAQLKLVLIGGAACPDDLLHEALDAGFPVHKTYGMTETLGQVTTVPEPASKAQRARSGTVLPYRELRMTDDGEIQVRGETLTQGKWVNGQPSSVTDSQGWFTTGDLGEYDEGDGLRVVGRKDNVFISGGENIVPEEVESALLGVLDCEQAYVVPAPCDEFGQKAVAFLDIPEDELVPETIIEALRESLPGYKIPRVFRSLPPTDGLKVSRAVLRDLASQA